MTQAQSILTGIKVIEVSTFIFGPGCGAIMSDFGADVIKVETPGMGDPLRHAHKGPPFMPLDFPYAWQQDNRNKRSIALDLKSEEGYEVLKKLVSEADVLITNFPPKVLEKLKIRHEDLAPGNDQLIYAQITGYGEKGDDANTPGFDGNAYWARTGLMDIVRTADSEPTLPALAMGDHPSAMTLYAAIVTGLFQRERTGKGAKVYSSLMANGLWAGSSNLSGVLAGTSPAKRMRPQAPGNALVNHYQTKDERWLSIIVLQEDKNWPKFIKAIERPDLAEDPRFAKTKDRHKHGRELAPILREVFASRDCEQWRQRLRENSVTFSAVATFEDVIDDPQALLNDMIIDVEGHDSGRGQQINSPFWVQGSPKVPAKLGPELGANSEEILRDLGYDDKAISELGEKGAIGLG
ncbi:MAG: CoA transferase [Porticoccaceae bacterium]|nr:CoA transferase [Porticoccaceae bacterium]